MLPHPFSRLLVLYCVFSLWLLTCIRVFPRRPGTLAIPARRLKTFVPSSWFSVRSVLTVNYEPGTMNFSPCP